MRKLLLSRATTTAKSTIEKGNSTERQSKQTSSIKGEEEEVFYYSHSRKKKNRSIKSLFYSINSTEDNYDNNNETRSLSKSNKTKTGVAPPVKFLSKLLMRALSGVSASSQCNNKRQSTIIFDNKLPFDDNNTIITTRSANHHEPIHVVNPSNLNTQCTMVQQQQQQHQRSVNDVSFSTRGHPSSKNCNNKNNFKQVQDIISEGLLIFENDLIRGRVIFSFDELSVGTQYYTEDLKPIKRLNLLEIQYGDSLIRLQSKHNIKTAEKAIEARCPNANFADGVLFEEEGRNSAGRVVFSCDELPTGKTFFLSINTSLAVKKLASGYIDLNGLLLPSDRLLEREYLSATNSSSSSSNNNDNNSATRSTSQQYEIFGEDMHKHMTELRKHKPSNSLPGSSHTTLPSLADLDEYYEKLIKSSVSDHQGSQAEITIPAHIVIPDFDEYQQQQQQQQQPGNPTSAVDSEGTLSPSSRAVFEEFEKRVQRAREARLNERNKRLQDEMNRLMSQYSSMMSSLSLSPSSSPSSPLSFKAAEEQEEEQESQKQQKQQQQQQQSTEDISTAAAAPAHNNSESQPEPAGAASPTAARINFSVDHEEQEQEEQYQLSDHSPQSDEALFSVSSLSTNGDAEEEECTSSNTNNCSLLASPCGGTDGDTDSTTLALEC